MNKYKQIINDFAQLEGDYKGEVFAAELVSKGLSYDEFYFKTLSVFKRPISNDIAGIKTDFNDNGAEQLIIELNREGLYDMLPEGIFHYKDVKGKDKDAILENIEKARVEEQEARRFFGPFENEFFQLRLQLELKKKEMLQPDAADSNRDFFETVFGNSYLLNEEQALALLYILPMAHKIRGDRIKIANCISTLIHFKTTITFGNQFRKETCKNETESLGKARLGIDTIAGNSFRSLYPVYKINVEDISKSNFRSFFPGGSNFALIHYLAGFLFPVECYYELNLSMKESDREIFISGDKNEAYLGFNSYL